MTEIRHVILLSLLILTGCTEAARDQNPASQKTPSPLSHKSLNYFYTIKETNFTDNHKTRVHNKENIQKLADIMNDFFKTGNPSDKKYAKPQGILQWSTDELETIFNKNPNIEKAFTQYKVNSYFSVNKMLRENKYFAPVIGPEANCSTDPTNNSTSDGVIRNIIHCMDLAFKEEESKRDKPSDKTIVFRTIRSDSGDEFDGLTYGCFNPGQKNHLDDAGFGSSTTSFGAALHHHDNIAQEYNKKTYADTIYKLTQKAIIFMIEVDGHDPLFQFPESLDTGTMVTVKEHEVLLNRGYRLQFSCEPNEFLPEIPNEFEYIPQFKIDAASPTDYKIYRIIRAKLVYPSK
ncbi:MAG TPA: hypothetical protein VEL47_05460 [Myxococcota bacterium]|nr:hypothetical protein [Myxococcota bacterium]